MTPKTHWGGISLLCPIRTWDDISNVSNEQDDLEFEGEELGFSSQETRGNVLSIQPDLKPYRK